MWTGIILACTLESCRVFAGPVLPSEEDCFASITEGAIYIQTTYPELRLVDYKCVQWSEGA
jgi:hypothetical protein